MLYLGESGARVLRYGIGWSQVGDGYQFDVTTHDYLPAGPAGDVVFRFLTASIKYTNGFHVGVTPIVDGLAMAEQVFTGSGSGNFSAQAKVAERGHRCAVRLRTLSLQGEIEIVDVNVSYKVIRAAP